MKQASGPLAMALSGSRSGLSGLPSGLHSSRRSVTPAGSLSARSRSSGRVLLVALLLVVVGAIAMAGWLVWSARLSQQSASAPVTAGENKPMPGDTRAGAPDARSSGPEGRTGQREARKGGKGGGDGKPLPVTVARLERADLPEVLQVVGTAAALNTVVVRPRVDGVLQSVLFREGDRVAAGDVLAQLDAKPFEVAVRSAEGALERDRALLRNAELDLQRFEDLWQKASVARQQLDTQRALVQQLQGAVRAGEAAVEAATLNLSYCRIRAPIAGRLGLRQVDAGNAIRSTDASGLVTITQDNPIAVVFSVPDVHVRAIQTGLRTGRNFALEASDRSGQARLANGRLQGIDSAIDAASGTLRLKAVFANPAETLFPNQFVNVRLVIGQRKNVLVAPLAALQRGAEGAYVALVGEDQTIRIAPVQTGLAEGERVEISGDGLEAGLAVVTAGVDRLRPGSKVEVMEPSAGRGRSRP